MNKEKIVVIGAGLAGCEAAYQIAKNKIEVDLYEMRPVRQTPAHNTEMFAELVCSNSLKSNYLENASGILKEEMRRLGSLIIEAADKNSVPAGKALAVDRTKFAEFITNALKTNPYINIKCEEFCKLPDTTDCPIIIASGPLTSESLSKEISRLTCSDYLYFFDAISPIIDAESINFEKAFFASRYEKGENEQGDYLNCPLEKEQYYKLIDDITSADSIDVKEFDSVKYFESCLPVEVIASRGKDSLKFGPMKSKGITNPNTSRRPYAVVQLRKENSGGSMYNMVGFQTRLKYSEQKRVFSTISGLENAEFLRYGSMHRNTYINSPKLLNGSLQLKNNPNIFFAGQIVGVEGYVESAAMGIIAGRNASNLFLGKRINQPSEQTSLGSLLKYITDENIREFQPMNINFGLYPDIEDIEKKCSKSEKRRYIALRALEKITEYIN
ncbi:MAG: methylenetetrahydrofolate--tRNA-(uracil(54)-C(5))-methyltransferase (FADH(2)-oxidizing) TrmFO [Candidatus Dadabacteria bacterium]|nr:methylenetetrahydrofolate--tRNA-(uracil(54)-C(5))-methyltransferase (FADH(2)-oxidizing) TrmFO [Candidatus Dadabacteria bacterium]NIS08625.1 methylenetetrahydrofolate--tRNA-(uracil(54)-C(5))-methyltransferase (FADH(2)-oxidizing) TrmFO [Candidatus Dadabacteria bacterium]NIV42459.1 methylenetetrahydrofolate--tRNA-(uracil(54)-C(5))-methyltransferase (FADH(2)-oxidizing) TrmFO [Candidatus Dadabacteria bacterium]NIX15341.1 methylenetetrahydrofolate--tRNA-(uracil(54)-C(5))-methyltransferase (FADH(2)-